MKCRLGSLSFAIAALLFGAAHADADILAVESGTPDVLRFTPAGTQSTFTTTNLDLPIGINADAAGNVYVVNQGASASSTFTNSVAKFTSTGTPLGFFVTTASQYLNVPTDIAFDAAGNAYVTSGNPGTTSGYGVERFTSTGSAGGPPTTFAGANANMPTGIGYNPANGLLYVVNSAATGTNANSILAYNPAGNPPVFIAAITPTGAGALDGPQQLAFDSNGNIFVASVGVTSGHSTVQEYSAAGTYIQTIATTTTGAEGVAYDPTSKTLYVSYLGSTLASPAGTATSGYIEKYTSNGGTFTDAGALATGLNQPTYLLNVPSAIVPEPGSVVLMGLGVVAVAGYRARRVRAA